MKEHSKRRRSMEEFFIKYLKQMENRLGIKNEKAILISKQQKEEKIARIVKSVQYFNIF